MDNDYLNKIVSFNSDDFTSSVIFIFSNCTCDQIVRLKLLGESVVLPRDANFLRFC